MRRPAAPLVPRFKVGDHVTHGTERRLATVRAVKRWPRTVWYVLSTGDTCHESELAPC